MVWIRTYRLGVDKHNVWSEAVPVHPCLNWGTLVARLQEVYGKPNVRIKSAYRKMAVAIDGVTQMTKVMVHLSLL